MKLSLQVPRAMRAALISLLTYALLLIATQAQTPAPQAKPDAPNAQPADVVGTWEGTFHSVPAITLRVKADGEKLSGTAIFYRIVDKGDGAKVDGQVEVELLEPKLVGMSMTFKVKPPPPPDVKVEPKTFDMELKLEGAGAGVVVTKRSPDAEDDEGGGLMQLKVTRKQ